MAGVVVLAADALDEGACLVLALDMRQVCDEATLAVDELCRRDLVHRGRQIRFDAGRVGARRRINRPCLGFGLRH